MVHDVASVVGPDGWITWEALTARVDRKTVGRWTAQGRLVRLGPGVYTSPELAQDWRIRLEAAVRSRGAVASHRTALALWGLLPPGGPIHLTVQPGRSNRGADGVVLHRARDLRDLVRNVGGVHVTSVERAVVDTWARLGDVDRPAVRAAAITAVRRRMCRPRDLDQELDRRPQLPARSSFSALVRLLADGARASWRSGAASTCSRRRGCRASPSSTGSP